MRAGRDRRPRIENGSGTLEAEARRAADAWTPERVFGTHRCVRPRRHAGRAPDPHRNRHHSNVKLDREAVGSVTA
jgi:hypothetical protein